MKLWMEYGPRNEDLIFSFNRYDQKNHQRFILDDEFEWAMPDDNPWYDDCELIVLKKPLVFKHVQIDHIVLNNNTNRCWMYKGGMPVVKGRFINLGEDGFVFVLDYKPFLSTK